MSSIEPGLAEYNILDPAHVFTINITAAVSRTPRITSVRKYFMVIR